MAYDRDTFSGYLECPMCSAEVPISDEEKTGEQVYCPYCQCPLRIGKKLGEPYLTEDF